MNTQEENKTAYPFLVYANDTDYPCSSLEECEAVFSKLRKEHPVVLVYDSKQLIDFSWTKATAKGIPLQA